MRTLIVILLVITSCSQRAEHCFELPDCIDYNYRNKGAETLNQLIIVNPIDIRRSLFMTFEGRWTSNSDSAYTVDESDRCDLAIRYHEIRSDSAEEDLRWIKTGWENQWMALRATGLPCDSTPITSQVIHLSPGIYLDNLLDTDKREWSINRNERTGVIRCYYNFKGQLSEVPCDTVIIRVDSIRFSEEALLKYFPAKGS